jgi:hypothetical protein
MNIATIRLTNTTKIHLTAMCKVVEEYLGSPTQAAGDRGWFSMENSDAGENPHQAEAYSLLLPIWERYKKER